MNFEYFRVIENWYKEYNVNHHHIESFNNFLTHGIRQIIESNPISFTTSKGNNIQILIDNIYIPKPFVYDEYRKIINITPHECRMKNLTYSSPIYVSLIYLENGTPQYIDGIILANIPIMIRSNSCTLGKYDKNNDECYNDPGGYFIINGIDRVLVSQRRDIYNSIRIYDEKDKYSYRAEIRSMSDDTNHSVLIQLFITTNGNDIFMNLPFIKNNILISIIFMAFNLDENDVVDKLFLFEKDIVIRKKIRYIIHHLFEDMRLNNISTQEEALQYIGSCGTKITGDQDVKEYAKQVLFTELFPHLGIFSEVNTKIDLLIYIVYKLLYVYHKSDTYKNDRDNLIYKRFENSGILLYELFKSLYRGCITDLENDYEKNMNIIDIFNKIDNNITKNIKYCFSTGKWGVQRNSYIRQGVSQVLSHLSYISMLSHLQRVVIPVGKEGKNFNIRQTACIPKLERLSIST